MCLYASAALCYLWQFWPRDRGTMLSGSETSNKTSSAASLTCRPVFQLTLFSWQHQTVCVLSAKVMSKQIPLDRKHNNSNEKPLGKNGREAAIATVPIELNISHTPSPSYFLIVLLIVTLTLSSWKARQNPTSVATGFTNVTNSCTGLIAKGRKHHASSSLTSVSENVLLALHNSPSNRSTIGL